MAMTTTPATTRTTTVATLMMMMMMMIMMMTTTKQIYSMPASAKAAKDGQRKTTSKDLKLQKQQQHKQKT